MRDALVQEARWRTFGFVVALLLGAGGSLWAGEAATGLADSPSANTKTEAIQPLYRGRAIHRFLWGDDYRDLWTAPIRIEVLDLQTTAGGLKPLFRVGGQQTKGLALKGKDGRDYTFRSIDKDPTELLPDDLRDTWARALVQDQMAASHPASFLVVDSLMVAAGILRTEQRLVILPDDPALGEFRKDFAGVIGQFFEFAGAISDKNPGFQGATEVLKHKDFYARILADAKDRPDARAFLKARLFDILIGDWDRHRDQWRWVKLPGQDLWQPMPDDRDQAFSRYDGLVLGLVRERVPILQTYKDHYPKLTGLTWNGWEQDRELLAGFERPVFQEVAAELKSAITDAVIDKAAHAMPNEYFKRDGARLIHDLKGRRDGLLEAANRFYEHISDKVRIYLTDGPDYVEARHQENGDLEVKVWRRGADGNPAGEPWYHRTLLAAETREAQVYLRKGQDKVVTLGPPRGVLLRVITEGQDVVDDSKGGGTQVYDRSNSQLVKGPGTDLDTREYKPPPPPKNAPWVPARDWGRDTFVAPWVSYGSDLGVFLGAGIDSLAFAFRKEPYANRHVLRAGWSFGESTYRADYQGEFRFENTKASFGLGAYASGIETLRFFGFGNETSDRGNAASDFFKVRDQQFSLTPVVTLPLAGPLTFSLGPTLKYSSTTHKNDVALINQVQPYGYGGFGEIGATGLLELDTRQSSGRNPRGVAIRTMGYPRGGAHLTVRGQVWPKAWDVKDTFGSVDGSAAVYLTPGSEKAPTLALRVGGRKVFGTYPFFEAAYLGSGTPTDELIRGLNRERYAGDSAVFGNADLRIYVSRFRIFLPGEWGIFGFGDGGRVYLEGESSNKWHYSVGGGLWFAWLDRSNTVSFSFARSEGRNAGYVKAGFAF
jgi:hypothetical protein